MLGSYPAQSIAGINGTLFEHWPTAILQYCDWFVPIGACFFVLAFVLSPYLQRFISLRFFRFLGYISFCFYLLHPIVIGSFSSYLFLKLHDRLGYHFTVMVVFFLTVAVTFILSWLMTKFIDEKGVRFSRYVYERWFKKEAVVTALHREQ
jgi:peptidoglycan/LPS O-acetylase OafA/YrhL